MFAVFVLVLSIGYCLGREAHPWEPHYRDKIWQNRHQLKINMTLEYGKEAEVIFIGDSITEMWNSCGKDVWNKYYAPAPRHALNYGIGGDGTSHVIWRIENKELDGLKPKVAVLMIGTNNLGNTVEDIAHGVKEVLHQITLKLPETKILLLGILPRKKEIDGKAQQVNNLIQKMANDKTVYWLDMRSVFTRPDGQQMVQLFMHDQVHLMPSGYEVWHKTMEPLLVKLIQ